MTAFQGAIQPTSNQRDSIASSHANLRQYLRGQFSVDADFLTGSYVRNTMVRQSRDCDMFIVLNPSYWHGTRLAPGYGSQEKGPANLLDRIKRSLQAKFQQTEISRDGQAVRVEFQHIHMDVVPAFATDSGYVIPDTPTNSWLQSNPRKHAEAISATNNKHGCRLIPLVKMLKSWNVSQGYDMKGFFLEMWARDMFEIWDLPSHAEGIRTFFTTGVSYIDKHWNVKDPGSSVDLMQAYMRTESRRTTGRARFVAAADLADRAIQANQRGDNASAIGYWKRLFGDAFPSYG
jgi:hypothetical protein